VLGFSVEIELKFDWPGLKKLIILKSFPSRSVASTNPKHVNSLTVLQLNKAARQCRQCLVSRRIMQHDSPLPKINIFSNLVTSNLKLHISVGDIIIEVRNVPGLGGIHLCSLRDCLSTSLH